MQNETLDLFEARIVENLNKLEWETNEEKRTKLIREIEALTSKMTDAEELVYKFASEEAQRKLDDTKSLRALEAEQSKASLDWKRAAVEIGKIAVPATISLITLGMWNEKFEQVLKFEESGRFTSTGFRLLKFPRIM